MMHCILVFLAATTQPASRPAPDLSRMSIDRVRSYAIGLFNRVTYLEQQLATERRTSDALRKTVADGDAKIVELQKEVARLKGTPQGKQADDMEAAIARQEVKVGMTVEQLKRFLSGGYVRGQSDSGTTMIFSGGCMPDGTCTEYVCTIVDNKLASYYMRTIYLPRVRAR